MIGSDTFWFRSSRFEVEDGEDLETNPGMFGRQLANWLADRFRELGYEGVDAYGEDWGWRVDCQRKPFDLFLGCSVYVDTSAFDASKPLPDPDDLVWMVFAAAEQPFLSRLSGKVEVEPAFAIFEQQLREILETHDEIELVGEPDSWTTPPPSEILRSLEPPAREPMPGWLSVPLGIVTLVLLPLMLIAIHEVLVDPAPGIGVLGVTISLVVVVPTIWMIQVAGLLLLVRPIEGLTRPIVLRIIALAVLLIPARSVVDGYHASMPVDFAIQVVGHVVVAALLWRHANWKGKLNVEANA